MILLIYSLHTRKLEVLDGKSEKSLHVLLEDKQIENLETYMKAKGLENRSQAIRHLLNNIEEYINKKD